MDYTSQKILFKLRKTLRYIKLYGIQRTIVKVKGQYHMKKRYAALPVLNNQNMNSHIGLIGCGNFAYSNIAYYLSKNYGKVIRAVMDIDIHKAASLAETYKAMYYTDNAEQIIEDKNITLVYIASNHASHTEYAIKCLEAGKCVHIEKPHVVNEQQLLRLCKTLSRKKGNAWLGFNRPGSTIGQVIAETLHSQKGTMMLNWFIAGHEIAPDHWYFKEEEGGRVLGNLCHWTDFVYQMIPKENRYPIVINPTRAAQSDCDIAVTYTFGDGSIAALTFSAKGHTFEGVRERFAAHRGNVLISMDDFKTCTIENIDKKKKINLRFRDHGHERNIRRSYAMLQGSMGCTVKYVWETGELFLATKRALECGMPLTINRFDSDKIK